MTYKEKYMMDHPDCTEEDFEAIMKNYCPSHFYKDKFDIVACNAPYGPDCNRCWNLPFYDDWHDIKKEPAPVGVICCITDGKNSSEGILEKDGTWTKVIFWTGEHHIDGPVTHWMLKPWPELPEAE